MHIAIWIKANSSLDKEKLQFGWLQTGANSTCTPSPTPLTGGVSVGKHHIYSRLQGITDTYTKNGKHRNSVSI